MNQKFPFKFHMYSNIYYDDQIAKKKFSKRSQNQREMKDGSILDDNMFKLIAKSISMWHKTDFIYIEHNVKNLI